MCVSVLLLLFSFLFLKRYIFYSEVVKGAEIVQYSTAESGLKLTEASFSVTACTEK